MNLQPLGICMSYQRTREIVKLVAQDYDVEVQEWADELKKSITISPRVITVVSDIIVTLQQGI